jgi:hypothetical protein
MGRGTDARERLVDAPDAEAKARLLRACYEGLLTRARISNDVGVLRELTAGIFAILGVKPPQPVVT